MWAQFLGDTFWTVPVGGRHLCPQLRPARSPVLGNYGRVHPIVVMCLVLLFLGAALAAKWGRLDFGTPPPPGHVSFAEQFKRALWYLDILVIGGVVGGLLAAGAGGRLAMRLLAVTSGDRAQGRITEADEVVGEVTVGDTIGFIVFGGLFAGLVCAVIYLLLRKWLPRRRWGALALGGVLLVTLGSRVEPLRSDNPDFSLVGPAWLTVSIFAALAFLHASVLGRNPVKCRSVSPQLVADFPAGLRSTQRGRRRPPCGSTGDSCPLLRCWTRNVVAGRRLG